jgi:cyclopropane fatty-acyl-phospholipid synthase-like methyltransferase/DUF1365 family protein
VNRLYEVDIAHHRQAPVVHRVRQRSYLWYVDLDELPRIPALAHFRAADHFGDPRRSIRANVEAFVAEHGINLDGGRITMLAQPRSLGYVFNPLSVFWCHDRTGSLVCVVAEVHNTYGEGHAYLVHTDDRGGAETAKEFYVSPFYPVDGYYRMSMPEPRERLAVTITLHRPNDSPFVATVRGVARPATALNVMRMALRYPASTYAARAGITWHGVRLYLKGLPVMPRPGSRKAATGPRETPASVLARLYREFVGADLPVQIRTWDGSVAGPTSGPTVVLNSRRALRRIVARPDELGLARAYVSGDLDVDGDLAEGFRQVWAAAAQTATRERRTLTIADRGRAVIAAARLGAIGRPPKPPAVEARIAGKVHTRSRDRAVIAHHYDLSNEFYELILDESMAYSSAVFADPELSLAEAQRAKLDLICRKLKLEPGMRLLDVGCGWGALILHAAEHYGVTATGITLSTQQREFVSKRVAERGLAERVTVNLCDYRDLEVNEPFDGVASIEMGEHVGLENYPTYVTTLSRALAPGGRLLLQQMSRRAGTAPGGGPFIEAYIAPDMHMRPLSETAGFLERAGFEISSVDSFRSDYALTARRWLENFERNYAALVELAGEPLARVWRLYLVGGALSFEDGRMGVEQILATR